jgi:hypothetical protein
MLASHEAIGIPPEGGFIVRLGWKYDRFRLIGSDLARSFLCELIRMETFQDWRLDTRSLEERILSRVPMSYPELVTTIYQEYMDAHFPLSRRWGDKTTWYLQYLPQLLGYFPDAKFVHIIRDGRDVAASYRNVRHLEDDIRRVAMEWALSVSMICEFGETLGSEQYFEVRYEDLVRSPERMLRNICTFLAEEYSPKMLDFWKMNREREFEPERHMQWKRLTQEPVTSSRVERWRQDLSEEDIQVFNLIGGKVLLKTGYPCCQVLPPPLRSAAIWVDSLVTKSKIQGRRFARPLPHRLRSLMLSGSC